MANDTTKNEGDDTPDSSDRHAKVAGTSEVRQATGYDDGADIEPAAPEDMNDRRYDPGDQAGTGTADTEAETGDTEANTQGS